MSFLKDFKEDLSQAVNELVTEDEMMEEKEEFDDMDDEMVNTFDSQESTPSVQEAPQEKPFVDREQEARLAQEVQNFQKSQAQTLTQQAAPAPTQKTAGGYSNNMKTQTDEVTEITVGTVLEGNMSSNGSINLNGKIKGNIACHGKLVVSGTIVGTSQASEIFTNNARIEGDVASEGSIKIGNGSVVLGNVYATSAVIGGAVRGDIDVHGPVIIDATAVVQGNIKSRSVQVNNGAAIEGNCSQCYADIDYEQLFDNTFAK